ncbi:MAG: CoA-binding protein [Chloroflexi bacterium]|nr:CoA-binding protein [Chloroflexota bacterium]
MNTIDSLVQDFLAQKRIAVVGVSRTREDAANLNYRKLRGAGYRVFAVNPNTQTFDGDPCYPDLKSIPEKVDGVLVVTNPSNTEQIARQCVELGIPRMWMHCSLGARPFLPDLAAKITSASPEAVRLCREHKIAVIPGGCPMMFCPPVDFGHACMRGVLRLTGSLQSNGN